MAMTPYEKHRVLDMLDQLDEGNKNRILASAQAFGSWLYNVAYSIWLKVSSVLDSFWDALCDIFS